IGFCLLIRRAVLDQIGLLDERFGIGCFEDDDFCLRAVRAGWKAVVARDAFVHHYGNRTFQGNGIDLASVMAANHKRFLQKWGADFARQPGESWSTSETENTKCEVPMNTGLLATGPSEAALCLPVSPSSCPAPKPRFTVTRAPTGGLLLRPA